MSDNRTDEFLMLARALPPADMRRPTPTSSAASQPSAALSQQQQLEAANNKNPAYAELRNFHATAGGISRDIATTSQLLSQLTNLVRHKSMFDDESSQINTLVLRIKKNIENLNSRLDQATYSIAQQKRKLNAQAGQEAANLVDGLKTEFAQAASGFKKVLQQRTDNMKESEDFQRQVYGKLGDDTIPNITLGPPPVYNSSAPPTIVGGLDTTTPQRMSSFPTLDLTSSLMSTGEPTGSGMNLPRPHGAIDAYGGNNKAGNSLRNRRSFDTNYNNAPAAAAAAYSPYDRANSAPLTPHDIQQMEMESGLQETMQLIPAQDYLRERADAMSTVETNIVQLGTIFNKLAVMVSEHQEMVQRVEDNVEDANTNISLSLGVLTDTLTSLRTNRMLALKVFSILVMFIIFFIVFFA
jgi:syntaxin 5